MNNLERNLAILEKKAARDAEAKNTAKNEEEKVKARLIQEISNLKPRIADLIEIGQKCQDLGIAFPEKNEMHQFGYDSRFVADGVNHDLGFITKSGDFKTRYLGIKNGGYNGPWDFYTDGTESFSIANKNYLNGATGEPTIQDMKKFLKQFDSFESAFYQWIDSLNKAEEMNVDEVDTDECVKRISLRNLYENGIKSLTIGTAEIVYQDGRYILEHNALLFLEDGEELKFQFFDNANESERYALGISKNEHGVYFTKKEYRFAIENPAFPENIRKQLKDFKGNGKPLKYLINYIPDEYFNEQKVIAELTELGYDTEEVVKCLEHDFGFDMKELSNENSYAILEPGKTYKFAGYDWTACEVDNKRHSAVIQSHGVTHGAWPGFAMQKFGGKADTFYALDIDSEDISAYDDKMYALYKSIIDVEDTSASYGIGLYLVSADKAGFTELGKLGSGSYWKALKTAATNSLPGASNDYAWLGAVSGRGSAWCVNSNGGVYGNNNQGNDFVVAPAFNLDLSKVEVVGNEIVIKDKDFTEQFEDHPAPYHSIWEYGMDFTKYGQTIHVTPEMVSQIYEAITEDNGRNYVATYTSRKFAREQYIAICDEVENMLTNDSVEYRACEHVLGKGFDKE